MTTEVLLAIARLLVAAARLDDGARVAEISRRTRSIEACCCGVRAVAWPPCCSCASSLCELVSLARRESSVSRNRLSAAACIRRTRVKG